MYHLTLHTSSSIVKWVPNNQLLPKNPPHSRRIGGPLLKFLKIKAKAKSQNVRLQSINSSDPQK